MFTKRSVVTLAATFAGTLVFAPSALGITFAGTTAQGEDINLRVGEDGRVERAIYYWDMTCKEGGSLTNGATVTSNPRGNPTAFESKGTYSAEVDDIYTGDFKVKLKGERVSDRRFRGYFKVKVKIYDEEGERIARCSTGIVRWTADSTAVEPESGRREAGELSLG